MPKLNKRTTTAITLLIALIVILAGTFAWYSFNQSRVNVFRESVTAPGVNLHDDFEGSVNKDVYVENSGKVGVFVRVRLAEFLETVNRGSLVAGHLRSDDEGDPGLIWSAHNVLGGSEKCDIIEPINDTWNAGDNFHDYHKWTMGGQKYYKSAIGLLGFDRALSDNPEVCNDSTVYDAPDGEYIRQTLPAFVITMEQWVNGGVLKPDGEAMQPKEQGTFWVVDTDGWCYWAQCLEPDQATGLLLDKVDQTGKMFDSDATYCIDVWLQAVDATDVGVLSMPLNGGITQNANILMQTLSGGWLTSTDGSLIREIGDGTFTVEIDKDGNPAQEPRYFVPLGSFADTAAKISAPEDKRLYIGDKVDITLLTWDGGEYINYDELAGLPAPFYNVTVTESGQYTVIGTEIGADGNVYLRLFDDETEESCYLASVLAVSAFATEAQAKYVQGYPGTGPFGLLYKTDVAEQIGTENDLRKDPVERRYFRHIGSGVYIETAGRNGAESINEPVTYYFAGEVLPSDPYILDDLDGIPVEAKVEPRFNLQLTVGEGFDLMIDEDGRITGITKDDEVYYMKELVEDTSGKLYIDLDNGTYIGPDSSGVLGGGDIPMLEGTLGGDGKLGSVTVIATPSPAGTGSQEKPFKITKRADMDWLTGEVNYKNNTFENLYLEVGKDFNMGETPFLPVGSEENQFMGTFDGANYTISGLKVTASANYGGLFGYIGTDGTIENLTLKDVAVDVYGASVGGLAGRNEGTIKNCHIESGSVIVNGSNVGGIAGYNTGTVQDCRNSGNVSGTVSGTGGVVGNNTGTVQGSCNTGEITGSTLTGGVAGENTGGTIIGCYNLNNVTGGWRVGGVSGANNNGALIEKSFSNGNVKGTANAVGGVSGNNANSNIRDCYAWGDVWTDASNVGGITGYHEDTSVANGITNSYHAKGTVKALVNSSGGLVGEFHSGILKGSVAYGTNVSAQTFVNRVIGFHRTNFGYSVSNHYYSSSLTLTKSADWTIETTEPTAGKGNIAATQDAWTNASTGPGFNFTTIWRWDPDNNLPVLQGVTP